MSISKRGLLATQTELRSDFALFFEAKNDAWHASENPGGKFALNMAENNLSWDKLKLKLESILKEKEIPEWVANYTGIAGSDEFLLASADFLSKHLCKQTLEKENLLASAGATAVVELFSWVFCDEYEVAVLPAPCYPVYTQDMHNKGKVDRFDLVNHHHISELIDGQRISIEDLNKTKRSLESQGKSFKMLLLTNPDNPTGCIYPLEQLREISIWCITHKVHLVVNELYGLSIIDVTHPILKEDYKKEISFESFVGLIQEFNSPYLHASFGLSKDFGISGLRVGYFYSLNELALQAYMNLNGPHMVSNLTQWLIAELFTDHDFITEYIDYNQKNLTEAYLIVVKALRKYKIPYNPSRGSLFSWLEMSSILPEETKEAEHALWLDIYHSTGVLLTPGNGFGHSKLGQFRLVYSFLELGALEEAMKRLGQYYQSKLV